MQKTLLDLTIDDVGKISVRFKLDFMGGYTLHRQVIEPGSLTMIDPLAPINERVKTLDAVLGDRADIFRAVWQVPSIRQAWEADQTRRRALGD